MHVYVSSLIYESSKIFEELHLRRICLFYNPLCEYIKKEPSLDSVLVLEISLSNVGISITTGVPTIDKIPLFGCNFAESVCIPELTISSSNELSNVEESIDRSCVK